MSACRRGYDEAHEMLRSEKDRAKRTALKEILFPCHYGYRPCGWKPRRPLLCRLGLHRGWLGTNTPHTYRCTRCGLTTGGHP